MKNYWRCHCGDGGFDQKTVVAPRLRCDGGIKSRFTMGWYFSYSVVVSVAIVFAVFW